ncbi:MAG: hypothetical protein WCR59_12745, partial [Planctomycetota bacterium]
TCDAMAEKLSLPIYGCRANVLLGERAFFQKRDDEARSAFRRARELASDVDHLGGALASIWQYRLGDAPLHNLPDTIEGLGLPELSTALLLSRCQRARTEGDEAAAEQFAMQALSIVQVAVLPLPQHLRALCLAGREAAARTLARSIAERMPDRRSRKRFLAQWERGARS